MTTDQDGTAPRGSAGPQRRVNRAKDKHDFFEEMTRNGPFEDNRDVLIFAAAVGWYEKNSLPLGAKDEPIRWETATNRRGTEALVNMIAVAETSDPEILANDRFDERLAIFEGYANGGLEILRNLLATEPRPAVDVILELIQKVARSNEVKAVVSLAEAADTLEW